MLTANRARILQMKGYDRRVHKQLKDIEFKIKALSEYGRSQMLLGRGNIEDINSEVLDILEGRGFEIFVIPDILGKPVYYLKW